MTIKSVVQCGAMRHAFLNMRINPNQMDSHKKIIKAAGRSVGNGAGERRIPSWNAHLKQHTYDTLKARGVMA